MSELQVTQSVHASYAFVDRDGTLIYEPKDELVDDISELRILDGVIEGLRLLLAREYKLVMVTNQDHLGTSTFPQAAFDAPHNAMLQTFDNAGITFEAIFICPHVAGAGCDCRKPKTGLVDDFVEDNPLDRETSFMCGDRITDGEFAVNIGIRYMPIPTNGNFLKAIQPMLLETAPDSERMANGW